MSNPIKATRENLSEIASNYGAFAVLQDSYVVPVSLYVPEATYYVDKNGSQVGETEIPNGWEAVSGYSGQHGYSGPDMHPSEYLGGGMARDVLEDVGAIYATQTLSALPNWDADDEETETVMMDADGWILLKFKTA